jgi:hypothetical protein
LLEDHGHETAAHLELACDLLDIRKRMLQSVPGDCNAALFALRMAQVGLNIPIQPADRFAVDFTFGRSFAIARYTPPRAKNA